jgi:hypothetical protein
MSATATATNKTWISAREALRRLGGMNNYQLMKLATVGRVATQVLPGAPIKYSAADVATVAAERQQAGN